MTSLFENLTLSSLSDKGDRRIVGISVNDIHDMPPFLTHIRFGVFQKHLQSHSGTCSEAKSAVHKLHLQPWRSSTGYMGKNMPNLYWVNPLQLEVGIDATHHLPSGLGARVITQGIRHFDSRHLSQWLATDISHGGERE